MFEVDFEYFLALVNQRSMLSAAEEIGVSQSSISRAIQRIESRFSVKLFERAPRGVILTPTGVAFAERLKKAKTLLDDAEKELIFSSRHGSVQLNIAVGHTIVYPVISALVPRLKSERPAVTLRIDSWFNNEIISRLANGDYDFAVCVLSDELSGEFFQEKIFQDKLVAVARKKHPLFFSEIISISELRKYPWVSSGSKIISGSKIKKLMADFGMQETVMAVSTNSFEAMLNAVQQSDCVCFAPDWIFNLEFLGKNLKKLDIDNFYIKRDIGIIRRTSFASGHLSQRAQELIIEEFQGVFPP